MRFIVAFFLLFLSFSSFAADWYFYPANDNKPQMSTADGVCQYLAGTFDGVSDYKLQSASITSFFKRDTNWYQYSCIAHYSRAADGATLDKTYAVWGEGTTCPNGSTFNEASGSCDAANKCAASKGASSKYRWESATQAPGKTISRGGCELELTGVTACFTSTKGIGYTCTGTVTSTGNELAADPNATTSECTGDDCTKNAPQPQTSQDAPSCSTDSTGVSTCTSKSSSSNPGTATCNAGTCVESPRATSKDTEVTQTTKTTTNTDGTSTDATTTKNTTTSCIGAAGSCTSTSSVSTGSKTTDSKGNVISQSSTCSGTGCKSNGTTPTASESAEEGDDDEDDKFPAVKAPEKPTAGNFDGQEDAWDTKINTAKSDLKDALGDIKNAFSPVGSLSLAGGAKLYCPAPVPVPLLNITLSFCADEFADSLSWIGAAIYAACAIIALFIVFG